jgi:hypothetical protein
MERGKERGEERREERRWREARKRREKMREREKWWTSDTRASGRGRFGLCERCVSGGPV